MKYNNVNLAVISYTYCKKLIHKIFQKKKKKMKNVVLTYVNVYVYNDDSHKIIFLPIACHFYRHFTKQKGMYTQNKGEEKILFIIYCNIRYIWAFMHTQQHCCRKYDKRFICSSFILFVCILLFYSMHIKRYRCK